MALYKLPFVLNFTGPWLFADTTDTTYESTAIFVDPADFSGSVSEAFFGATGEVSSSVFNRGGSVTLTHSVDGDLATLEWLAQEQQNPVRPESRVGTFNPSASAGYYKLRVNTPKFHLALTFSQAVIVRQYDSNIPASFWLNKPMLTGDASSGGFNDPENDLWSYVARTISSTPTASSPDSGGIFNIHTHDLTKFTTARIDRLKVFGTLWNYWLDVGHDDTATATWWNKTKNLPVSGAVLTTDQQTPTYAETEFLLSATNLDDGDDFEFRINDALNDGFGGALFGHLQYAIHMTGVVGGDKLVVWFPVNSMFGGVLGNDIASRALLRRSWFPDTGVSFKYELTGLDDGANPTVTVNDTSSDFGTSGAVGTPGTITVIQGAVTDPDHIISQFFSTGFATSSTPNEEVIVELEDFIFDGVITDPVQDTSVRIQGGPYNQTATMGANINGGTYVTASQSAITRTGSGTGPDPYIYHLVGLDYDFGTTYDATDLNDPALKVRLKYVQPNNATPTEGHWRTWAGCLYVLCGSPIATIDFSGVATRDVLTSGTVTLDDTDARDRIYPLMEDLEFGIGYITAEITVPAADEGEGGGGGEPGVGQNFKLFSITLVGERVGRS